MKNLRIGTLAFISAALVGSGLCGGSLFGAGMKSAFAFYPVPPAGYPVPPPYYPVPPVAPPYYPPAPCPVIPYPIPPESYPAPWFPVAAYAAVYPGGATVQVQNFIPGPVYCEGSVQALLYSGQVLVNGFAIETVFPGAVGYANVFAPYGDPVVSAEAEAYCRPL